MKNSVVENVTLSSLRAFNYWRALEERAVSNASSVASNCKKSIAWPIIVYSRTNLASSDVRFLESELAKLVKDDEIVRPEIFIKLLPQAKVFIEYPLTASNTLSSKGSSLPGALKIINRFWPEAYDEIKAIVVAICWFDEQLRFSYSSPKTFGLIHLNAMLRDSNPIRLATSLIHEAAHHALFIETAIDKTIPQDFSRMVYSPLRNEQRPAIASLHALMAMARMLIWSQKIRSSVEPEQRLYSDELRESLLKKYGVGLLAMANISFSESGSRLFSDLEELNIKLLSEFH